MKPFLRILALSLFAWSAGCRPADAGPVPPPSRPAAAVVPAGPWGVEAVLPPLPVAGGHLVEDVVADAGGRVHAVFAADGQGSGVSDRVLYAVLANGGWSAPEVVDASPSLSAVPRLAVDGDGAVHALWMEGDAGSAARVVRSVMHSRRGARGWSRPVEVYRHADPGGLAEKHLAVTTDPAGRVRVVHASGAGLVQAVLENGAWRAAPPPAGSGIFLRWDESPRAADSLELAHVASYVTPERPQANSDVYFRAFRGGRWGEPVPVHVAPSFSYDLAFATDARGVRHLVWMEADERWRPMRLLHSHSADGARWSAPADVTPDVPGGVLGGPRLMADAHGTVHLTFGRYATGYAHPRFFHQRLRDRRWSPPDEIHPASAPRVGEMEAAIDGSGTLHVVWKDAGGAYHHAALPPPAR